MTWIVCLCFWFDLGHTMAYDCSAKTHGYTPQRWDDVRYFRQEHIFID
jgi:hypothetical protein